MKFIDEYRNREKVQALAAEIKKISKQHIKLMEVCGGHTMSIQKFGIPYLLPDTVGNGVLMYEILVLSVPET